MSKLKVTNARRKQRVRLALRRTANGRPRLSVFRSSKHIYAQVIDDVAGNTLVPVDNTHYAAYQTIRASIATAQADLAGTTPARGADLLTGGHAEHMRIHLYGMWVAFSVAACFLVYFLVRIRRVLAARDLALQEAQRQAAYKEKLASLATLAAGAAHELATPLSTIALVAQELEHHPELHAAAVRADIALIRSEVARCRVVLDQMAVDAGQGTGDALVSATLSELLAVSCAGLPLQPAVVRQVESQAQAVVLPLRTLGQALRGLVKNAQEASPSGSAVVVRSWLEPQTQTLQLEVQDHGTGMSAEVAQRVGEPFFSTKAEGHGMGLGVFLCRAVVESLGGELQLTSTLGAGTRATVRIPVAGPSATCRLQPAALSLGAQGGS